MKRPPLRVSASFVLLVLLFYLLDTENRLPMILLAAALHEGAHALCILLLGGRIREFRISGLGGHLIADNRHFSYGKEIAVALAGPLTNVLVAFATVRLSGLFASEAAMHMFAGFNLLLGLFNLFPVHPLDGGRIVRALALLTLGPGDGERLARFVSIFFSLLVIALGVLLFRRSGFNVSLLILGVFLLAQQGFSK